MVSTDERHYILPLGRNISVTCSSVGVPQPTLSWFIVDLYGNHSLLSDYYEEVVYRNMSVAELPNGLQQVNQSISGVLNMSYTGGYICEAKNEFGTAEAAFDITVQCEYMYI